MSVAICFLTVCVPGEDGPSYHQHEISLLHLLNPSVNLSHLCRQFISSVDMNRHGTDVLYVGVITVQLHQADEPSALMR